MQKSLFDSERFHPPTEEGKKRLRHTGSETWAGGWGGGVCYHVSAFSDSIQLSVFCRRCHIFRETFTRYGEMRMKVIPETCTICGRTQRRRVRTVLTVCGVLRGLGSEVVVQPSEIVSASKLQGETQMKGSENSRLK